MESLPPIVLTFENSANDTTGMTCLIYQLFTKLELQYFFIP